jgi:hypothetical protein
MEERRNMSLTDAEEIALLFRSALLIDDVDQVLAPGLSFAVIWLDISERPGGWNRIQIEVDNRADLVSMLRKGGAHFRNDIVSGNGGKQILLDDPSDNPIELFEPERAYVRTRCELPQKTSRASGETLPGMFHCGLPDWNWPQERNPSCGS